MARKMRESDIPTEYKEVVYYLGLDPKEIVSVKKISTLPQKWDVHLRWGDKEWHGHLEAPPFTPRPPVTRLDDLLNSTMDCPACKGGGKVPEATITTVVDLRTASADEINEGLNYWRGWRLAFDTMD